MKWSILSKPLIKSIYVSRHKESYTKYDWNTYNIIFLTRCNTFRHMGMYTHWHNCMNPWSYSSLTHWGRDKMAAIWQTTFSNASSWMKIYEFRFRFHWSLLLRLQLTISQHCLDNGSAPSHYLNQWWLVFWRVYASPGLNELTYRARTK